MTFKVAVLQMASAGRDIEQNTATIVAKMQEASEQKADILLVPECFLNGYILPITNEEASADNDVALERIKVAAKKLEIGVVVTAFTKGNEKPQNSAFVINKNGEVLMKYAKVHTCDFADEACLESGNEFKVCDFHGVKIGIMICYDREYPESARVLMMKGAELILVPNDCTEMKPRVQAISTRAYENMVGIAMANPPRKGAGCSCAFSPICWNLNGVQEDVDNTIFVADQFSEGIFYADFDMDVIRNYREREMMGNTFRKVKAYGELMNTEIQYPFIRKGQ